MKEDDQPIVDRGGHDDFIFDGGVGGSCCMSKYRFPITDCLKGELKDEEETNHHMTMTRLS